MHASSAARFDADIRKLACDAAIPGCDDPKSDVFALVYNWLRDRRNGKLMIVLDNVDNSDFLFRTPNVNDESGSNKSALRNRMAYLPPCAHGSTLITSRSCAATARLTDKCDVIAVHPMGEATALALLEKKLGQPGATEDTQKLAAALDHMPLALAQAGAYIKQRGSRYSVGRYLARLEKSEKSQTSLLISAGKELRRDEEAQDSIILTWQISFDHIRATRPSAADLLSLMCMYNYQGIPEYLLRTRGSDIRHSIRLASGPDGLEHGSDASSSASDDADIEEDEFEDDILTLENFHFISTTFSNTAFEMHRLVQLAARVWLRSHELYQEWARKSVERLDETLPTGEHENWGRCGELYKAFEAIQKVDASDFSLRLIKDLGVRWNSTYSMIHRAIQLKEQIKYYCKHWRKAPGEQYDLTADFPDREAWNELEHYDELLAPFATATKRIEGNAYTGSHGALWECIPTMDYLFFELKERADEVTAEKDLFSDHFRHCLNHSYSKLYHYYNVIDKSRLYAASVALHPCMKYSYIEERWPRTNGREAIDVAKEQVQSLFDEYLAKHRPTSPTPALAPARAAVLPAPVDAYKRFLSSTLRSRQDNLNRRLNKHDLELQRFMDDELDTSLITYVNGVSVEGDYFDEPLRWWRERGESSYPILAAMAYDLFSLLGMSSECERSFSAAKRMITDARYQLKTDLIEADQCVKSWFKHGLANGQHAFTNIADLEEVAAEIAAPAIVRV